MMMTMVAQRAGLVGRNYRAGLIRRHSSSNNNGTNKKVKESTYETGSYETHLSYIRKAEGQVKHGMSSDTPVEFWGTASALVGWSLTGASFYDWSQMQSSQISGTSSLVLVVYSSLMARWAYVIAIPNLILSACHMTNAGLQMVQLVRVIRYKIKHRLSRKLAILERNIASTIAIVAASLALGPGLRTRWMKSSINKLKQVATAEGGLFTIHFWAPVSQCVMFLGSVLQVEQHQRTKTTKHQQYDDPSDINLFQSTTLLLSGICMARYSLLVKPVNKLLCAVNVGVICQSSLQLARKFHADYLS
eukprot:scaffold555424_cov59-Attheya_sp.AAC.1